MAKNPKTDYVFDFTVFGPTANRFNWCAPPGLTGIVEKCAMGERGTGKTDAGIGSMTHHALRQPEESRPIPWVIVRDTWANLERTVLESFLNPRPHSFPAQIRPFLKVKDGGRYIELPGLWYAYLFGVDSLRDLEKLRMQIGGLWVEEPAPAAISEIGGGIDEYVVTLGKSSLRYPCQWQVCQITMNYPDEEHWTWKRYGQSRREGVHLFQIRKGENPAIGDDYYQQMAEDFKDNPGLLQRLVLGQPGFVPQGEVVTPEFDLDKHKAKVDFEPYPGVTGLRFWDGGLNPTCIFGQVTPRGYLRIFPYTLVGQGIGVKQLIVDYVKPILREHFREVNQWRDIGDPSMAARDSSDSEQSPAKVIETELKTTFEAGSVEWTVRREGLKSALNRQIDGLPWIQISASERQLTRALRGGWHYRKDASGRVLRDKPVKDIHSHPGDAFSYGATRILNYMDKGITHVLDMPRTRTPRVISAHDWHPLAGR
ncbi:MAG: hypothetical protein RBR16_13985 [Syntrophus sp. (in: bacteria)]|nr:hypothetical protein [Syntrophus sp. (in: bacteria)]